MSKKKFFIRVHNFRNMEEICKGSGIGEEGTTKISPGRGKLREVPQLAITMTRYQQPQKYKFCPTTVGLLDLSVSPFFAIFNHFIYNYYIFGLIIILCHVITFEKTFEDNCFNVQCLLSYLKLINIKNQ